MIIEIDYKCDLTPERQLADAIALRVLTGRLRVGEPLPPAKDLALQLEINPHLVERAYELVREVGLAAAAPEGAGWLVAEGAGDLAEYRAELVGRLLQRALGQARELGVPRAAVAESCRKTVEEYYGRD
jgi:DNA-binding transcriptional regulator YhcF (GntR family)